MRTNLLLAAAFGGMLWTANDANAQESTTVIVDETVITEQVVDCKTNYSSRGRDNWFIQLGAGIQSPFVENSLPDGTQKHHLTPTYNVGFGKWWSPYFGWRLGVNYGAIHWDYNTYSKAKTGSVNLDIMWDMFNSLGGVNTKRVFSIVPFIGVGGAYTWDYKAGSMNIVNRHDKIKSNQWTLPASAGIQLRFRLSNYVDFFAEGRAQFHGDNFDNTAVGNPIDMNLSAIGGFTFHIGGNKFTAYNPCDYLGYINQLNNQVNDLRGALATTTAALAAAEAQLPCPEVTEVEATTINVQAPILSAVRFKINSAKVSDEEMVNVYNLAEWMKANPDAKVIVRGYADKDTGTSAYNMQLSEKRAQNVAEILTNTYGIDASRLSIDAQGSDTQVYDTNNWNRIVIFAQPY